MLIGNDVVNLNDPAAAGKSGNTRFLSRIFTPSERRLIGSDAAVWALWAAKETAYKVVSKKSGPVSASPLRYEVFPDLKGPGTEAVFHIGIVGTPCGPVFFRLTCGHGYVHCFGADEAAGLDSVRWGIERVERGTPRDESDLARKAAAAGIAAYLEEDPEDVEIRNIPNGQDRRLPAAFLRGESIPGDLTLSHDFPYIAYAFYPLSGGAGPGRSWTPGRPPYRTSRLSAGFRLQTAQPFPR